MEIKAVEMFIGSMTKIGATTNILYGSKDGKNFTVAKSYNYQDYPIMMSSGKHYYEDLFTYYFTYKSA